MNVRLLYNSDIKALEDFLAPYKSSTMFIHSNLKSAGIEYQEAVFHGEYRGFFLDSSAYLKGLIVHYWNGNIMMCAPDLKILSELIANLKSNLKRPIRGILGPNIQAELVIDKLGLSNAQYSINRSEGLYELNLSDLPELKTYPGYNMVKAKEISKDLLMGWMKDYEVEALGAEKNLALDLRAAAKTEGLMKGDCWILVKNEVPVSLAAFNACLEDRVQVGPVWTPPDYRNQGFAKLLLSLILKKIRREGAKKAILFADNPPAVKVYEAIGFKIIGDYRLALLKEPIKL
jgi:GNAT superfamily N-acetyltransferase